MTRLLPALLLLCASLLLVHTAHAAQEERRYTADDVIAAIQQYSEEQGVSKAFLMRVVRCETGGTFDPYSVGKQGELGAAQLHPRGLLPKFYDWGYTDVFSPYQSVRFLAQEVNFGRASAWSCA